MIRAISLAAALALLPMSAALAASDPDPQTQAAEARIEALAAAFEARMEAFGTRAEAIAANSTLTEAQKEAATTALWSSEFQPEVASFTAQIAQHAGAIAQAALANIDIDAVIAEALKEAEPKMKQAMASAGGIARNSAWVQDDPEQLITYELIADYALAEASEAIAEAYNADVPPPSPAPPVAPEAPEAPVAPQASPAPRA